MDERIVHASRAVHAPAATIFELVADPARQAAWDGNDNLAHAAAGQRVHAVGDVFVMRITSGAVRENHVVAFDEGRTIAWRPAEPGSPPVGHEWRWEVEDLGDGTSRVTHTYDWRALHDEQRLERARATTEDRLRASLDRLAALAERIAPAAHPAAPAGSSPYVVVVVPAHDPEALDVLVPELLGTADGADLDLDVVVVPATAEVALAASEHAASEPRVDVAPVAPGSEGAAAFADALRDAARRADVVATLGGHGRNDPAELPALLARLDEHDVDVVVGDGLALAAAPGFAAMHADVAVVIADRIGGGIARVPIVAASLGLAVARVDVDDRDAPAIDDVLDGWHAWHDRIVLGVLDRRVLRILAAVGAALVVAGALLGLALVVPAIIGLGVLPGIVLAAALAVVGTVVLVAAVAIDAVRATTREHRTDRT